MSASGLNATVTGAYGHGRLEAISVRDSTGQEHTYPAAGLFVLIGADPHSDWLADVVERDSQGFLLTDSDLVAGRSTDHHCLKGPALPVSSPPATYGMAR